MGPVGQGDDIWVRETRSGTKTTRNYKMDKSESNGVSGTGRRYLGQGNEKWSNDTKNIQHETDRKKWDAWDWMTISGSEN